MLKRMGLERNPWSKLAARCPKRVVLCPVPNTVCAKLRVCEVADPGVASPLLKLSERVNSMIYTYSRSILRIARYLSNTFLSLSSPIAERIELPRKVWANIFHPRNRTKPGSCLNAAGMW